MNKEVSSKEESVNNQKIAWYILDEIAVKHSASHVVSAGWGETPPSYKGNPKPWGCSICDRAIEAMSLLEKPTHEECQQLYSQRKGG